jgi:shikimate dehydrogenase
VLHSSPIKKTLKEARIIINATSVGMKPYETESPIDTTILQKEQIVLDAIYHPRETVLLQKAKSHGATAIPGIEMLLYQATAQFALYTNRNAPEEAMRKVLYEN